MRSVLLRDARIYSSLASSLPHCLATPGRKHGARTSTMNRKYLIGKHTNQPRYREKINHRCDEGQHQPSQNHPPIRQFRIPLFHLTPLPTDHFSHSKWRPRGDEGGQYGKLHASCAQIAPKKTSNRARKCGLSNIGPTRPSGQPRVAFASRACSKAKSKHPNQQITMPPRRRRVSYYARRYGFGGCR